MPQRDTRRAVILMLASTFLFWFSVYTYPSFLTVYAQEAGAAPALAGMIIGSYGLVQMLLRIPLGIYSDVIKKRKPFMVAGVIASILSGVAFMTLKSPMGLLAARAMAGVTASTWVTYSVLYSSLFSNEQLSGAMGRLSAVQYAAQLIAMLLGGYLAHTFSYDAAFLLAIGAGAAGMIVLFMIDDRVSNAPPKTVKALLSAMKNRSLLISTGLSVVFYFVCWGTVLGFTASWARDIIGMDNAQLGILSAFYLLPNMLVPPFIGKVTGRFGVRPVVTAGFLIIAGACLLFPMTFSASALYLVQILFGLGMSLMVPIFLTGAIAEVNDEQRGVAMGFYQSIYGVGMFLGPLFAGRVIEWFSGGGMAAGYAANFRAMAIISAIGLAMALIFFRKREQPK